MTNFHRCPNLNCQAEWGIEEISFQECDCCGWPEVAEGFLGGYDPDDDEGFYPYESELEP